MYLINLIFVCFGVLHLLLAMFLEEIQLSDVRISLLYLPLIDLCQHLAGKCVVCTHFHYVLKWGTRAGSLSNHTWNANKVSSFRTLSDETVSVRIDYL